MALDRADVPFFVLHEVDSPADLAGVGRREDAPACGGCMRGKWVAIRSVEGEREREGGTHR